MDSNLELFQKVTSLWSLIMDSSWFDNECNLETFLGAHYAQAVLAGDCLLTEEGLKIVEQSKIELIELLNQNDEDFDESMYL